MTFAFDHAILAVADLDRAIADFKALGFSAFYGGQHADGRTHNGLIVLADGGYLELLAPVDPDFMATLETIAASSFLHFVARGDGWAGYALGVDDLEAAADGMRERGLALVGPTSNGRLRPDGVRIAWRIASFESTRTPFFITDETPRVLRVPDDADKITHANGAVGVAALGVAVQSLDAGIARYRAILGMDSAPGPEIEDAQTARFALGNFDLILAAPVSLRSPLQGYLDARGAVPYEIRLRTNLPDRAGLLDMAQSHGARIALV